ncbi:MAG: T9SS type A sorting domain-containing protein, partial [Chitinophagaceae bacterium]|nr:T9SS type A sorting domain-containing protein [Chitinophagaceae bacterium]
GPWSTDACGETATRTRQRSVITPAANGGAECGPLTETETRQNPACPVDCVLSDWGEWSPWSTECGFATRSRFRTVITPAANGGAVCGPLEEIETRNVEPTVLTTTVTNCSAYTWPVNGSVYTTSGQYTVVNGCTTHVLNLTIASSAPVVSTGVPANVVYRAIEARWKGFNNTSGVNTALYLGNNNMASGGTNRVEVGRNGLYAKPGETPVSFVYSRAGNLLTASVGTRSVTYTNVSARATGNMGVLNFMHIMLRTGSGNNTGVAEFRNVVLNGQALGNFVTPAASLLNWTVTNVDFSQGFVLTGIIRLDAGTYGTNEGSKLDIWVGHNNSPLPCTNTAAPIALRADAAAQAKLAMQQAEAADVPTLDAEVLNNPAAGNDAFQLRIKAAPQAAVQMRVVDAAGRPVEGRQQLRNNEVVRFGSSYRAGIYLVELQDGQQRKLVKVLKQ